MNWKKILGHPVYVHCWSRIFCVVPLFCNVILGGLSGLGQIKKYVLGKGPEKIR